jgi:phospholipid-transporting ATPase
MLRRHVLADRALAHAFAVLGAGARAVVVCRASPRQKSAVVQLMQRHLRAEAARLDHAQLGRWWSPAFWAAALRRIHCRPAGRTLAIGDGANDVAMLQAADVGIGIAGKEGRQAVNNADYAIGQFRFLARLLLVHGTLSHYRLARLIKYSFAKNVTFSGLLTFYQFYSGYSGQALYDSISAGLFNVLLTSLPILIFALVDRPVSDAGLLAHPQLYNRSTSLSGRAFWKTICDSTVASAVCFFVPVYAVPLASGGPRNLANMLELGKVGYTAVLTTVSLDLLLVSRYLTALFLGILALSVAVWWPLLYIVPRMADVDEMIGMASALFPAAAFWLIVALCTVITGSYRLTWIAFNRYFRPSDFDILAEEEVLMKARADGSDPAGPVGGSDAVADDVPAAYSAAADV